MPAAAGRPAATLVRALAAEQAGVVSRAQALGLGLTSSAIGRRTGPGGWRSLHPGVYLVDTGQPSDLTRVWAALLVASGGVAPDDGAPPRAVLAGMTALWLAGALDRCPDVVEVDVAADRRVGRRPGVRVTGRARLVRHGALLPPRVPLEVAVLQAVGQARRPEQVVDVVLRVAQRRLSTAARLRAAVHETPRLRWRALVLALCADVDRGVQSPLERRYRQRVERAHGLPDGERNVAELRPEGPGNWYRDVRYRRQRVVVELDGRGAHPLDEAFRDRQRDNQAARAGERALRYGWREVVAAPCEVAAEVAHVLAAAGWLSRARRCGRTCALTPDAEGSFPLTGKNASA